MIIPLITDCLLFVAFCLGLGLVGATYFRGFAPPDRLSLGVGAALVALYLANFALYILNLPIRTLWLVGVAGGGLAWFRREPLVALWREATVRTTLRHWLLLAGWCLGWQALVFSYSGARWSGDWQEHYDRAHFFIAHWPTDHLFIDLYPLPARPPLANLVIGGFLGLAGGKFFHFQIFSTLLSTLVFVPLAGVLHRLRPGTRPQAILLGLLMLNPLFVQNATFPWTKLVAAYFIVLAADLLTRPSATETGRFLACALVALAAALVAHYSAVVWILALAPAWLVVYYPLLATSAARRGLMVGTALGTLLFMTWLGWSLTTYGTGITFSVNVTTSLAEPLTFVQRIGRVIGNVYHTLIPAWLWEGLPASMDAVSQLARLRDRWFCLYQLTLPFTFGLGGLAVLARLLADRPVGPVVRFWCVAAPLAVAINATVHGEDTLGLTHLALQPLVLLGLVWLAATADHLSPTWRRWWCVGLAIDFTFGLALHFGVQSLWLDRALKPGLTDLEYIRQLCWPAAANYYGKLRIGAVHLADGLPVWVALALLAITATGALWVLRRARPA